MNIKELEKKLNLKIPMEAQKDLKKAINFYKKFHWGDEFKNIEKVEIKLPKAFFGLGHLIGIIYMTHKAKEEDFYIHVFKPPFPILIGGECEKEILGNKNILLGLGGFFEIKEEGIIH